MALTHSRSLSLLAAGAGFALLALANPTLAQSQSESCSTGGHGADATGNDCGSLTLASGNLSQARPIHRRVVAVTRTEPHKQPLAMRTPAKERPARPHIESANACSMGGSGVDATGNDCNDRENPR